MSTNFIQSVKGFISENTRLAAVLLVVFLALVTLLVLGVSSIQATWYSDTSGSGTWDYRQRIIIDSDQVDSNLQDFPVYVDLVDLGSQFFSNVAADGGDIRVTNAVGEELPREVVSVDTASSTGELHFKADNLSSTADTTFYIYYGNADTGNYATSSTYGAQNVWTNNEAAVWHLNEDPSGTAPQILDSTVNNIHGTTGGSMTSADSVLGRLGRALDFDGTDDDVEIPDNILINIADSYDQKTQTVWFKADEVTSRQVIWEEGGFANGINIYVDSGTLYGRAWSDSESWSKELQVTTSVAADTWYQVYLVLDAPNDSLEMFVNGSSVGTDNKTDGNFHSGHGNDIGIGKVQGDTRTHVGDEVGLEFNGVIDEVRHINEDLRSADWIAAEYTNQNAPNTFYTAGSQETQSSSNVPFGDNPGGDFADGDWDFREKITIHADQVDANLSDFPVYVDLADMSVSFFANTSVNCGDIRMTNASGTELAREVVACDTSAETGELHFKADSLSSTTDTVFYIYYDNPDAHDYVVDATYGAQNVWTNNHVGVWHLNESSGNTLDSTSNNNDATTNGPIQGVEGQVGDAYSFDGADDYVEIDNLIDEIPNTFSVWVKVATDVGDGRIGVIAGNYPGDGSAINIEGYFNGEVRMYWNGGQENIRYETDIRTGEWEHLVFVRDVAADEIRLYRNGINIPKTSDAGDDVTLADNNNKFRIGSDHPSDREPFEGDIDNLHIYNTDLSEEEISAIYNNQNSPSTFYTISGGVSAAPVLLTPEDTSTEVVRNPTLDWEPVQNAGEYQVQVSPTSTFSSIVVDADVSTSEITLGTPYPSLNASTTYHWRVRTVDGQDFGTWSTDFEFTTAAGLAGSGTEADPYLVSTPQDLDDVRNDLTAYYRQENDIDLTFDTQDPAGLFYNSGQGWITIDDFEGDYDLNGYSVLGMFQDRSGFYNRGLFRLINAGTLHDGHIDGDITGIDSNTEGSGVAVATIGSTGGVHRVKTTGSVVAQRTDFFVTNAAGITSNNNGSISDSYNEAVIKQGLDEGEPTRYGGIAGQNTSNINRVLNTGNVIVTTATSVGAVRGLDSAGDISNSFYDQDVVDVDDPEATGLTTANAQSLSTYENAGWDIVPIEHHDGRKSTATWYIDDGNDYPRLWFEYEGEGWYDDGWSHREKVTINASEVDATLEDFPVYVDLADFGATFFANVDGDGGDIRVTKADGTTELPREVVSVDTGGSSGELHFKADRLSSTTDTTFYVYYGNPDAIDYVTDYAYGAENVWTNGTQLVYHLQDDPSGTGPQINDSTSGGYDGTASSMQSSDSVTGKVGKALAFDGTKYIDTGTEYVGDTGLFADGNENFTVSIWSKINSGDEGTLIARAGGSSGSRTFQLVSWPSGNETPGYYLRGELTATNLGFDDGTWHQTTLVWNGSQMDYYLDGEYMSSPAVGTAAEEIGEAIILGARTGGSGFLLEGLLDEPRIWDRALSQHEVSAEYTNQNDPSTFYTVAGTEDVITMDGTGTAGNPYLIETPQDLDDVRKDLNAYYQLANDIDLTFDTQNADGDFYNGGSGWDPIATTSANSFTGSLDFEGYKISGLMINKPSENNQSLFGFTDGVEFNDVWIEADITGRFRATILTSLNTGVSVVNGIKAEGVITGEGSSTAEIGIVVGYHEGTFTVNDASFDVQINNPNNLKRVGGAVGHNYFAGDEFTVNRGLTRGLYNFDTTVDDTDPFIGNRGATSVVNDSFIDSETSGFPAVDIDDNTTSLTTAEAQDIDTYLDAGWDIIDISQHDGERATAIWFIDDGNDYPRLWFERDGVESTNFGDSADGDFVDTDWGYREKITINASEVDATLTDFPVYIDLADLDSEFFDNVKSDGGDIRVTAADGTTELAREVVSIDTAAQTGELHFKAPSLSASTNTEFYIYFGNSSAVDYQAGDTYGRNAMWSNGYKSVYHMQEDPSRTAPQIIDSTGGDKATSSGAMTIDDSVSGQLAGNALDFDGSDDHVHMPERHTGGESEVTLSLWLNPVSCGSSQAIYDEAWDDDPDQPRYWQFAIDCGTWYTRDTSTGKTGSRNNDLSLPALTNGSWQHLTFAYSAGSGYKRIYLDGAQSAETTNSVDQLTSDEAGFDFIARPNDGSYFDGNIDEVRVATAQRSQSWIAAEYTNQNAPSTFYTVGDAQTVDESAAEGNSATEIRGGEFRGGVEFR
ncbi:MAG: DUF2341 domain-containing protein [Candidatus Paceibacterota bacterium]